jgi:hypothetical protein
MNPPSTNHSIFITESWKTLTNTVISPTTLMEQMLSLEQQHQRKITTQYNLPKSITTLTTNNNTGNTDSKSKKLKLHNNPKPCIDWYERFHQAQANERHLIVDEAYTYAQFQILQHPSWKTLPTPLIHVNYAFEKKDFIKVTEYLLHLVEQQHFSVDKIWLILISNSAIPARYSSFLLAIRILPDFIGGTSPSRRNLAKHIDSLVSSLQSISSVNDMQCWLQFHTVQSPLFKIECGIHFWRLVRDELISRHHNQMSLPSVALDWFRQQHYNVGVLDYFKLVE